VALSAALTVAVFGSLRSVTRPRAQLTNDAPENWLPTLAATAAELLQGRRTLDATTLATSFLELAMADVQFDVSFQFRFQKYISTLFRLQFFAI